MDTYEIISSALHARMFPGHLKRNLNKRVLVGEDSKYNFVLIDSEFKDNQLDFTARSVSSQGETEFSRELRIKRAQNRRKRVSN